MSTDLAEALADADQLQAAKIPPSDRKPTIGPGPDRPMPYIAALRAGDLAVDHTYQRDLDRARVRRMAEQWDPTMLGVLDVSDRGPTHVPRYAIINGQHRAAVAVLADPRGEDVPLVCNVHRGLTVAGEALLFHELDAKQTRLTSWDRWRARRAAGDRAVIEVEQVVAGFGMKVAPGQSDGLIGAAGSLETLHSLGGPPLVGRTLGCLHAAWGRSWAGYQAPLITGVGLLLHYYEDLAPERITEALGKTPPQQLRAQAVTYRELQAGSVGRLVAQVLINRMNTDRGQRLADVRDIVPAGRLRQADA